MIFVRFIKSLLDGQTNFIPDKWLTIFNSPSHSREDIKDT